VAAVAVERMERRSTAMFDTMTWEVAAAGREERLARSRRNTLLSAAEQASTG
jgi:hypothetical protein